MGRMNTYVMQPFTTHPLLRQADVQTMLSRHRPRDIAIGQREYPVLLDGGADQSGFDPAATVRLHGYYTPSLALFGRRGLVLVLHGWEGCSHSIYNLTTTDALIRAGYDVFRLNLRDHGPGLHVDPYALNRGFFAATLLDEVASAVEQVASLAGDLPFYIVGASLGGNLALRLALRHARQPIPNLRKVVASNPVLNPLRSAQALDRHPAYLHYFRSRWLRSLRAKQRLFPDLFDFAPLEAIPRTIAMTEWLIEHYGPNFGPFRSAEAYFAAYAVMDDAFTRLTVPTVIVTAANDPVAPVADFRALAAHPLLSLHVHPTGGHVGYMNGLPLRHYLPRLLMAVLLADDPKMSDSRLNNPGQ